MFHAKSPAYRLRENSTYRLIYLKGGLPIDSLKVNHLVEHSQLSKNQSSIDYIQFLQSRLQLFRQNNISLITVDALNECTGQAAQDTFI